MCLSTLVSPLVMSIACHKVNPPNATATELQGGCITDYQGCKKYINKRINAAQYIDMILEIKLHRSVKLIAELHVLYLADTFINIML